MTWLITGGAGYIGAHVVHAMRAGGRSVVVLDDLSSGDADRVGSAALVVGSVLDGDLVERTMAEHDVSGVIHLAGKKQAAQSITHPLQYYQHNVEGLRVVLEMATKHAIQSMVFSSSAAVYAT